MKIKIIQNIKAILLAFVLTLGISYVSAQVWSDPISYPPTGNVPAPINVGKLPQTKEGPLTSLHLFTPDFTFNPQTSPTAGQVLMAEDSTGKAKWGDSDPGNYKFTYVPGSSGYNFPYICRINISDGSTICKTQSNGYGSTWNNMSSPFLATSKGVYGLICSFGSSTYNFPTCCRNDLKNGTSICRETRDVGTTWIDITNSNPF